MLGGPRFEFPGPTYHVQARGDRLEPIVLGNDDRWMLPRTFGEMAKRTGIRIHAFSLMGMQSFKDHDLAEARRIGMVRFSGGGCR